MNPCTSLFTRSLHQNLRTRGICSVSRSLSLSTPPNPIVWKHPLVAPTRTFTTSLTAPARPPRIAQFLPNNVWKATHRSQTVSSSRSRNPYTPPPPKPRGPWRRFIEWLESIPSNAIVWAVLAINGAVFLSWRAASALYQSSGSANLYVFMSENFTASIRNIRAGRIWTIVTACFSHDGFLHIVINAITYYFMAPLVIHAIGNVGFLALYLSGGAVSNLTSLWWNGRKGDHRRALYGASGAVCALMTFVACAAPKAQFALYGIVPVPAWLLVGGLFLMSGYQSISDSHSTIDNAGHIGGILGGIGYYVFRRFRIF